MRKVFIAVLFCIVGTAGTAAADHRRDVRRDNRVVVRDHRWDNRNTVRYERPRYRREPVYVNNGRYTFHDGRSFYYRRPVINYRYTNYRYRPTILVENYDTVPGYIWVAGSWNWNGYEWIWTSGHYAVDTSYAEPAYYNNGYSGVSYDPGCNH